LECGAGSRRFRFATQSRLRRAVKAATRVAALQSFAGRRFVPSFLDSPILGRYTPDFDLYQQLTLIPHVRPRMRQAINS
jgi:hypothetical protein